MDAAEFHELIRAIPWGKSVGSALYVYRGGSLDFGPDLDNLLQQLVIAYEVPAEFNVIKFRTDELKISFLYYPDFLALAHPVLRCAITIDLARGKSRRTDYSRQPNPPILHRKETFLPRTHELWPVFRALTEAEDTAGLYANTTSIGFLLNWQRLLAEKRFEVDGHTLRKIAGTCVQAAADQSVEVDRHKTALTRYDLSKPAKSLLQNGLLTKEQTFFDYGCGLGSDLRALDALGFSASGWDPVHRSNATQEPSDVVNLGYVLNVIEDPAERIETLCSAFGLAKKLLVVSALINRTVGESDAIQYGDGIITKRNTFQKYFDQGELQQLIEDALETTATPIALGIFYVFRNPSDQQDFLSSRTKRRIDWSRFAGRLGLGAPRERRTRLRAALYEAHKELFDSFAQATVELGRLPDVGEFARESELRDAIGSAQAAQRILAEQFGTAAFDAAREHRRGDLLVYLALANLQKTTPFGQLSERLRRDIKSFFGDYKAALQTARELLFAAGDPDEIDLACEGLKIGVQDEQALFIHRSLVESLPPILRVYVGCALMRYGDMAEADLIKIHKISGKVTFLLYDDFDGKPLPELRQRTKVNLRSLFVQVFEYPQSNQSQLLYFKERYVGPEYPNIEQMRKFSGKLRNLGLTEALGFGPSKEEFLLLARAAGLNARLNKTRAGI